MLGALVVGAGVVGAGAVERTPDGAEDCADELDEVLTGTAGEVTDEGPALTTGTTAEGAADPNCGTVTTMAAPAVGAASFVDALPETAAAGLLVAAEVLPIVQPVRQNPSRAPTTARRPSSLIRRGSSAAIRMAPFLHETGVATP